MYYGIVFNCQLSILRAANLLDKANSNLDKAVKNFATNRVGKLQKEPTLEKSASTKTADCLALLEKLKHIDQSSTKFNLFGFVEHRGEKLDSGHYVSYLRKSVLFCC